MVKSILFIVIAFISLTFKVPTFGAAPHTVSSKPIVKFHAKTIKIKSLPFEMNGMHLQFQYTVKKDIYNKLPKNELILLAKKLVDMATQTVVCNLQLPMEDEKYPVINISEIEKEKYGSVDFNDVNFDGYKDMRESCESCGGATNAYEYVYRFNPHTKKFELWTDLLGAGIEINESDKTVTSTLKYGGGEFAHQEFKFNDKGIEIYQKNVKCVVEDVNRQTFRVVYNKYNGKKLVAHKTQIITEKEQDDIWGFIEKFTK